jgi:hypothetical protein
MTMKRLSIAVVVLLVMMATFTLLGYAKTASAEEIYQPDANGDLTITSDQPIIIDQNINVPGNLTIISTDGITLGRNPVPPVENVFPGTLSGNPGPVITLFSTPNESAIKNVGTFQIPAGLVPVKDLSGVSGVDGLELPAAPAAAENSPWKAEIIQQAATAPAAAQLNTSMISIDSAIFTQRIPNEGSSIIVTSEKIEIV